ncbi:unnamed protein product [Discosporangium mesarthrocarpum]
MADRVMVKKGEEDQEEEGNKHDDDDDDDEEEEVWEWSEGDLEGLCGLTNPNFKEAKIGSMTGGVDNTVGENGNDCGALAPLKMPQGSPSTTTTTTTTATTTHSQRGKGASAREAATSISDQKLVAGSQ